MYGIRSSQLSTVVLSLAIAFVACGGSEEQGARTSSDGDPTAAEASVEERDPPRSPAAVPGADPQLGEPLEHPERYYGLYANPQTPNRQWFVTEAKRPKYAEQAPEVPPGYLAIGAMFGDVAPWHMKMLSTTEFEHAWVGDHEPGPVTVQFELGSEGIPVAMTFTDERHAAEGRLERQGDLPENWQ